MNETRQNKVFTHDSSINDDWGKYQELVMKTLDRLENDIKTLQEKYQSDSQEIKSSVNIQLEKIRNDILILRQEMNSSIIAIETQIKVKALEQKIEEAQNDIIKTKNETKLNLFVEGGNKIKWILISGIIGFVFVLAQILVKIILASAGFSS